jgi:hypothetical protein
MSYCRWSSDNFKSDVYCYESEQGYVIHVADTRIVDPLPRNPYDVNDFIKNPIWVTLLRNKVWRQAFDKSERVEINLPHAGTTIYANSPAACAIKLMELQLFGYHVPQYAIDALVHEAEQEMKGFHVAVQTLADGLT